MAHARGKLLPTDCRLAGQFYPLRCAHAPGTGPIRASNLWPEQQPRKIPPHTRGPQTQQHQKHQDPTHHTTSTKSPNHATDRSASHPTHAPAPCVKGPPPSPPRPPPPSSLPSVRLSVAEVAEQVGVSTASIYFWETDHVRPRDANLSALCKVLKLPIRATREMAAA